MAKHLLGIDNGGSRIKCAIFDLEGNEVGVASQRVPLLIATPGRAERDANAVWRANVAVIREAMSHAGVEGRDIIAVGLTGYGNGLCLVDEVGDPTYNCIVSTDDRAAPYCATFRRNGAERAIFPMTYQTIWSGQPAALLPWFRDNEPEVLERSWRLLAIKDLIRYRLTGSFCSEVTDASSGCLFNMNTLRFDEEIFRALGLEGFYRLMPACVGSTAVSGSVTAEAAGLTGLRAGTPVAGGYFDIDASALASGILSDDILCLIAGTWSINEYVTSTVSTDYETRRNTVTKSFLDGFFLVEESTPTSASNFDWFVEKLLGWDGSGVDRGELYKQCDGVMGRATPLDSEVIFVPCLFGGFSAEGTRGAFLNMSGYNSRDHLLQAVFEGVAFSTMLNVRRLSRPASDFRAARLGGGVANSPVWSQMMADVVQMPMETLRGRELSAQGAAMGAGVACGEFSGLEDAVRRMVHVGRVYAPRLEYADVYARKFARFEKAVIALDAFHTDVGEVEGGSR